MATPTKGLALPADGSKIVLTGQASGGYGASIAVINAGTNLIEVGGDNLDDTNGFPLAAGSSLAVDLSENEKLFARSVSGAAGSVHVLRAA